VDGKRTRPWRVTSSTLTSQRYTVNMLDSEIIGL
jgi:glutamate formiminotransferase